MLDFIPDGYTETAYLKGVPGLYGEFRFTFRPMLIEERSLILGQKVLALPEDQQEVKQAQAVAARVTQWSLADAAGKPVDVSVKSVLRLKPALFRRLFAIVAGLEPADTDPQWDTARKETAANDALEAAIAGKSQAEYLQERDVKNCGPG